MAAQTLRGSEGPGIGDVPVGLVAELEAPAPVPGLQDTAGDGSRVSSTSSGTSRPTIRTEQKSGHFKNILGLHETDYFIWSNQASCSANTKLDAVSSDYTSSNYFSVQLAEHLNAKVSPCLAFLTEMHQAMSVPDSSGSSAPTYLDANGNLIKKKNLSKQAKQLLHDYQLIQYDMSVGKNYLKDIDFVDLPK